MRLIIVDDSYLIRTQLKAFLEDELGHEVVAMGEDGDELLDLYQKHSPDIVLLDLTMQRKGGYEALLELLEYDDDARVIMCSAIKESSKVNETLINGAMGYILKPLQLKSSDYVEMVKDALVEAME